MSPGNQRRVSPLLSRVLAGVEAGVLGGLAMFGWLSASAVLDRRSIWTIPNLLATTFYGRDVLYSGFSAVTAAGLALHFFVAGVIGLVFGLVIGDSRNRLRIALVGLLTGLLWNYLSDALFWKKLGALSLVYSPPRSMLLGHMVFGGVLAWFPRALHKLEPSSERNPPDSGARTGEGPGA